MRYFEKIKMYFLSGYGEFSLEIQHKIEYLFYFNIFASGALLIYFITRIFNPAGYIILAGDVCLFLFVSISLIAIRFKKILAVTLSVTFIPLSALCYNVLIFYVADQEISPTTIFSSLSFLMFGLLYLSLFSVRVNQLIFFALISAATLILNTFFIINSPFGFRDSVSTVYSMVGALLELSAGYFVASLILKHNFIISKNSEKSLIQSREHYSALFSNITDAFALVKIITDDFGRPKDIMILEVNKATEEFLNISRDEVVFKKVTEIIKSVDFDFNGWLKDIATVAYTGKELHKSFYSKYFKKWLYTQIFSPELNYCALLCRDITATVEADYELKRIQERNAALLEAIPDTIMVCDKDGFIKTLKRAPIELIENENLFHAGSFISQSQLPAEFISQFLESIQKVIETNQLKTRVFEIPYESVIVYAETRIVPLAENEVLILFRDLTRRILSEKALVVEKEKAEESDRLKMAFLSNMSHEIRTPMNAIIGFSELLGLDDVDEKERETFIYQIQSNGALLLNLINDILDLSKIEAGELEMHYTKFEINKVLHDTYLNFDCEKSIQNKSHLEILHEAPSYVRSIIVNADEYRLKQILFNLMGNALKFTSIGSLTLGYELKETEILFFVKDSGIGISAEKRELIFHRFRQVEDTNTRTFGGAGLGLTISRNLVEAMGGKIWVEQNEPQGSTFFFTLPLHDAKIVYTDNTTSSIIRKQYDWKGKYILIIDHGTTNQIVIQHLLSNTGVSMEWALNEKMVLTICNARKPDLVIIDTEIHESENEKIELLLRKRYPNLPIIELKNTNISIDEPYLSAYINNSILKPIKPKVFFDTINKYLQPKADAES